jgi:hypothetical protein
MYTYFETSKLGIDVICKFMPGGYDMEEKAARAYDLALKYRGPLSHINFPVYLLLDVQLFFLFSLMCFIFPNFPADLTDIKSTIAL